MSDVRDDGRTRAGSGDAEHDAWLRAALRHAPDAEAAPPLALRESILAQARAAARPTAPAAGRTPSFTFGQYLAAFWDWLARPPVAAGFASVMAATLVGMLWWDRPIDETLPQPRPFESAPQASAAPTEPVPPAPPSPDPGSLDRQRMAEVAPQATARPAPAPLAAPPAARSMPAPSLGSAEAEKERSAIKAESQSRLADSARAKADATPAPPVDALDVPGAAREERKDRPRSAGGAAAESARAVAGMTAPAPAPATAPAPVVVPAPASPGPAPTAALAAPPAATPAPTPFPAERRRSAPADAMQAAPAAPAAAPPPSPARPEPFALAKKSAPAQESAAANELAGRIAAPRDATDASGAGDRAQRETAAPEAFGAVARPMSRSLSLLAAEGTRWTRALSGGAEATVDAPLRAWLADVQATNRRWERRGERLLAGAAVDAGSLLLRRDGQPALLVRLEDGGVFFESAGGGAWFAALPPDSVARLRAALPAPAR